MIDHNLGFIEVIPDQSNLDSFKEIQLNTGGTQSTLQDIKITERADGFSYFDNGNSTHNFTRNRFIYWKISHDMLELVEESLDINLYSNKIRYRFVDTPILDGISIHETVDNIILLVPTVCSVHKLVFPHPNKLHKQDEYLGLNKDLKYPSIFSEAISNDSKNNYSFYVFSIVKFTDTQIPHLACSILGPEEEGIFMLAYPGGDLLLVYHYSNTENNTYELKVDSVMPRFLSGLAEKFGTKQQKSLIGVSFLTIGEEIYGVSLCREAQIKFWSLLKHQCVAVINVLEEAGDSKYMRESSQNYILRKTVDCDNTSCLFGIFVSYLNESKFFILKPIITGDHIELRRLYTIHSPERDLIDFTLSTSRIWSVWRTETGSCVVYTASLTPESYDSNTWVPVILENLPDSDQIATNEGDPRQVYLQQIFHPGRFPLQVINKALSIYKKSSVSGDLNMSASTLKQRICMAVENEIRNKLQETEVSDEDYLECADWCWQRFYSCCVQYHIAGLKPLGLLLLPSVSGAVLLKKSSFSFLRPMDLLEHLILCSEYTTKGQLLANNLISENIDLIENVIKLVEVIVYLEQQMSDDFNYAFEKELLYLRSPDVVIGELIEKIHLEMDSNFSNEISKQLSQCRHLYQVIHKLLELLRFEIDIFDEPVNDECLQLYFSSNLGISVLAKCIQQQAKTRFILCRNLLLITNILIESKNIEWNILEAIRSVCTPDLVLFTQANFFVNWLSSLPAMNFLPQEAILQRLSPLKLNPSINVKKNIMHPVSLLELFIGSISNHELARIPIKGDQALLGLGHWHLSLLPLVNRLFHIVWPINKNTLLAEWLLINGQHLWLQQYVRLLRTWCEWNSSSRCFLQGVSFLVCGEHYKATDCFQLAVKGIFTEKFFIQTVIKGTSEDNQTQMYVSYYLKVIKLLELHSARDFAIQVANTALSRVGTSDPSAATFYSIKFKHHLSLKHYDMAFDSLNSNPDPECKKDNLRDLVKKLLDEKKFDILLSFTYGSLEEFFCNILFTRARATEAINNIYYDFLYSYLMMRGSGFMRLAASVMNEYAIRIGEVNSILALEKQVKCLMASYNALSLCDRKFAWVVKPASITENEEVIVLPGRIEAKENSVAKIPHTRSDESVIDLVIDGINTPDDLEFEDGNIRLKLKRDVEVVDVSEIKKEAVLLTAKLKLSKIDEKYYQPETNPVELVFMLSTAGLFRDALSVATLFKLSYVPIFEQLTKQCILLRHRDYAKNCMWLLENDIQDLSMNKKDAAGVAWGLLQEFLNKYEGEHLSELHHAVCNKIINMRAHIPYWFYASYRTRNPAELLRLLHFNGRLLEAVEVAKEYILAVMGHGSENYGIKYPFLATSPPICFPVNELDYLIYELELQVKKDPETPLKKEWEILKELFIQYLKTAERLSHEKCRLGV